MGKAHAPYEFGVKVSIATTLRRSKSGQSALNAMVLPGNPYDGHTLATASSASSPMRAILATTPRSPIGSRSTPPARSAA